jgi:hypothetical protein
MRKKIKNTMTTVEVRVEHFEAAVGRHVDNIAVVFVADGFFVVVGGRVVAAPAAANILLLLFVIAALLDHREEAVRPTMTLTTGCKC